MTKKNIARTAIEGGRVQSYRFDERRFSLRERRTTKSLLRRYRGDPESASDLVFDYRKTPYGKDFADKLAPVVRWLDKQVGRPWPDVFSDICDKFDRRSLAGRHIIGHIEDYVNVWRDNPDILVSTYDKPYGQFDPITKKYTYNEDRKLLEKHWERQKDSSYFIIDSDRILRRNPDSPVPWRK